MLLEVKCFQLKQRKGKDWQYLTPKQMIQILPKFTKFIKWNQMNYIFFVSNKEVTKKVYNNVMNSIKL